MTDQNKSQFCHFLAEGNIVCNTQATCAQDVIEELSQLIARHTGGMDAAAIRKAVMLREEAMPTVIASGLAVPHARMSSVKDLIVAMAISRNGIDFGIPEMPPVKVVILLLTPENDPGIHLQVLAALSKEFSDPKTIEKISCLTNAGDVIRFFGGSRTSIPQFLRACDVMNPNPVTLMEHSTLHEAIEVFATKNVETVPVIDESRTLRGTVALSDLLKYSLPEHLLWLDDLSSIYRFQPFAEVLETADETKVADFMREEFQTVESDIPAVQLAKLFIMNKASKLLVVGADGKLAGEVDIKDFCAELFWK